MDGAGWMIGTTCCTRTFESLAYISVSPASFFLLLKGLAEEVVVLCWFFGCVGLRLVCVWGCVLVFFWCVVAFGFCSYLSSNSHCSGCWVPLVHLMFDCHCR